MRRQFAAATGVPQNWQEFLKVEENKAELVSFLAVTVTSMATIISTKLLISTHHTDVLCSQREKLVLLLAPMKKQTPEYFCTYRMLCNRAS